MKDKNTFKVYGISFLIAVVCIVIPWIMAVLGIIPELDVLEKYSFISAFIALVIIAIYACKNVKKLSSKLLIIFLNPAIIYTIILIVIAVNFANADWSNGFSGLVP